MKKANLLLFIIFYTLTLNAQHTFLNNGPGDRVGIFTTNPTEALNLRNGNFKINSGKIILGSNIYTPSYLANRILLDGGMHIQHNYYPHITIKLPRNINNFDKPWVDLAIAGHDGNWIEGAQTGDFVLRYGASSDNNLIIGNDGGGNIFFNTGAWEYNQTRVIITGNGSVGINTANPGIWKLAVNGKIRAKEIKVETGWADFVFEDDYDLPTLNEVERYIKKHGHLMNIPSKEEVKKNGVFLGEINSKLLQKIEELTLYIIQLEKRIKSLESK